LLWGFDSNSLHFKSQAEEQWARANKGSRREVTLEVLAIDGVKVLVEAEIWAVDGDRH
jgi:hypothetical protein